MKAFSNLKTYMPKRMQNIEAYKHSIYLGWVCQKKKSRKNTIVILRIKWEKRKTEREKKLTSKQKAIWLTETYKNLLFLNWLSYKMCYFPSHLLKHVWRWWLKFLTKKRGRGILYKNIWKFPKSFQHLAEEYINVKITFPITYIPSSFF